MPLVQSQLKAQIKSALDIQAAKDQQSVDPNQVRDELADAIAQAIYTWILTATILSPNGPCTIS